MNDEIKLKICNYFNNNILIHLELKNKRFYNGKIQYVNDDYFFYLIDREIGKIMILFSEVYLVEPFKEKIK